MDETCKQPNYAAANNKSARNLREISDSPLLKLGGAVQADVDAIETATNVRWKSALVSRTLFDALSNSH